MRMKHNFQSKKSFDKACNLKKAEISVKHSRKKRLNRIKYQI